MRRYEFVMRYEMHGNDGTWYIDILKWMIYVYEETVKEWYVSWHVNMLLSLICWYKEIV